MDYHLGGITAFSEMVAAGLKPLALSEPMTSAEVEAVLPTAQAIAARHGVELYREPDLLITDLFPANVAAGREVLLIYQGTAIDRYLTLKAEAMQLEQAGQYTGAARRSMARRFGRLLGYPPHTINRQLAENSDFRTMQDFGIQAGNVFLYYRDLERATLFYRETLGLEQVADYGTARIFRVAGSYFLVLVDHRSGMHNADEPKTVAMALLTDQLADWWEYLQTRNVPIKYPYRPRTGNAHDGFVAIDPEGYLLEFETFKPHRENELLIPLLDRADTYFPPARGTNTVPPGLGFKGGVTWLYYRDVLAMQHFYEEVLGLELIVDQGWAKIYRLTGSAFIGLVDERRGMHSFTDEKAVNVSFWLEDVDGWRDYVQENGLFPLRADSITTGPEGKYRAFVGYDPEGYFLEFDHFYPHADNGRLLQLLTGDER